MSDLKPNQIEKILKNNKEFFKAEQAKLVSNFIAFKTNMNMVHANAIAKGLVDKLI